MILDREFFEQIVNLIQPHMSDNGRKSLIAPAFSAYDSLYSRIDWSGNSRDFTIRIVEQFAKYGQVTPDQEALVLLLETLHGQVGHDVQGRIDEVLSRQSSLPPETAIKRRHTFLFAGVVLLAMVVMIVLYGYTYWITQPSIRPRAESETLVLVADILVPSCINDPACPADPEDVTQRLVTNMRNSLADYPEIRIERLDQFIEEEGGSERAMEIGRSPEFDATFVIWGNYLKAPEVYLFFDIMNTELPFFGGSYNQAYGPVQIQQPSMFEFKASLGQQWAYVTAFATGLTLFQAGNSHHEAEPLFDIAAQILNGPENVAVDPEMIRYLYLYRGTNYLYLGRANLAEPDLRALYEMLDLDDIAEYVLGPMTLGNLGNAYRNLGEYEKAIEYYESALTIVEERGDRNNEGTWLGNLGNAYRNLGEYNKAMDYYKNALTIAKESGDRNNESTWLGNLGNAYLSLGEYSKAIEYYENALIIAKESGHRQGEGNHLGNLGNAYLSLGEYEKAMEYYENALTIAKEIRHRQDEGNHLGNLGNAYLSLGVYEKAIEYYESALTIAKEIGHRQEESKALGNLGNAYRNLGEYNKAIKYYKNALTIAKEIGDRQGEGKDLGNLGNAYRNLGEYGEAIKYYEDALTIAKKIGHRQGEGNHLGNLGNAYLSLGEYEKAIEYYENALTIANEIGHRQGEGNHFGNLSNAYLSLGEYEKAIEFSESALTIAREIGDRQGEGTWLGNLGNAYLFLGEYNKVMEYYENALTIAREIGDRQNEGSNLGNLGNAYLSLGEYEKAIESSESALTIAKEIGDRQGEGSNLGNLGNAYLSLREYHKAIDYLTESYAILDQIKSPATGLVYQWMGSAYNNACWVSALSREPEIALPYCEKAVEHDPQSPFVRDSRGLAYGLLDETKKAIDDFQFFVDELKALDGPAYTPLIEQRQGWIDALVAGENPFTDEVLAALREE